MAEIDAILVTGAAVDKAALRRYLAARELAAPEDYGAIGDGAADDTAAINQALAATGGCVLGIGRTYRVTAPVVVDDRQTLIGWGSRSVLRADDRSHPVVHLVGSEITCEGFRTQNGCTGLTIQPLHNHNWHSNVRNLVIEDAGVGLYFDGTISGTDYRCYWCNFSDIAVLRPRQHGVLLDWTPGGGDTPNAIHFNRVHVFSWGQPLPGGSGFFVRQGNFLNCFVDCEANVAPDAHSCVRVGFNTQTNVFMNLYTESTGAVTNVHLDAGSKDTRIDNLFGMAAGPNILDQSGGEYLIVSGGYPENNRLQRTRCLDLRVERFRFETLFLDGQTGTVPLDLKHSCYLISTFSGPLTVQLPAPADDNNGQQVTLKKTDPSAHPLTVTAAGRTGTAWR